MFTTYYKNTVTEEITDCFSIAMRWYQNGEIVNVIDATNGEVKTVWEF